MLPHQLEPNQKNGMVGPNSSCNDTDASIRIGVQHRAGRRNRTQSMADAPKYLREEGGRNKYLSDSEPLQFMDERIRFGYSLAAYESLMV